MSGLIKKGEVGSILNEVDPVRVNALQRAGRGISGMTRKEEDIVQEMFVGSTHDYVLFVTDKGRLFRIKGYTIAEGLSLIHILLPSPPAARQWARPRCRPRCSRSVPRRRGRCGPCLLYTSRCV